MNITHVKVMIITIIALQMKNHNEVFIIRTSHFYVSSIVAIQMLEKLMKQQVYKRMPVLEINRLTNLLGFGVQTINLIALIIIIVSGLSIFFSLYNSLKNRRYELALIRVHGATKLQLIKLVFF